MNFHKCLQFINKANKKTMYSETICSTSCIFKITTQFFTECILAINVLYYNFCTHFRNGFERYCS